MNPGSGKVHRECAARCISGGVPPGFLVRDSGTEKVYLLTDSSGQPLDRGIMRVAAEPLTIQGRVLKIGDTLILAPSTNDLHSHTRGQ
jgi:hypothetical protein